MRAAIWSIMQLLRDESGATAVEYALIVALLCLVCVVVVSQLGDSERDVLTHTKNYFEGGH